MNKIGWEWRNGRYEITLDGEFIHGAEDETKRDMFIAELKARINLAEKEPVASMSDSILGSKIECLKEYIANLKEIARDQESMLKEAGQRTDNQSQIMGKQDELIGHLKAKIKTLEAKADYGTMVSTAIGWPH